MTLKSLINYRKGSIYFFTKSRVMAKFCQAVASMGVDHTWVFWRFKTLKLLLSLPDLPMMVPLWKLNWLAL